MMMTSPKVAPKIWVSWQPWHLQDDLGQRHLLVLGTLRRARSPSWWCAAKFSQRHVGWAARALVNAVLFSPRMALGVTGHSS